MITASPSEEDIFKVARKLPVAEARAEYLQQVCGNDEPLRNRVVALLQAHDEVQSVLDSPAAPFAATIAQSDPAQAAGPMQFKPG